MLNETFNSHQQKTTKLKANIKRTFFLKIPQTQKFLVENVTPIQNLCVQTANKVLAYCRKKLTHIFLFVVVADQHILRAKQFLEQSLKLSFLSIN